MCPVAQDCPLIQQRASGSRSPLTHWTARSLKALTEKTLTLFEAFMAFTFTTLPNMDRVPAGVAALCLILSIARPGMVNFPVFLHSATPRSPRVEMQLFTSF